MFKADNIGDGSISVTHSGTKFILVSAAQARRMGLGGGRWEVVPASEDDKRACWLKRTSNGERVLICRRRPEENAYSSRLVRSFCWDIFSKTTGVKLAPGEVGRFRLMEAKS